MDKPRRLKVLHLVGADNGVTPNALLLPLLTRGARQRIENQVVHFSLGDTQFGVVRQSGIPVHELPLSAKRFSAFAPLELRKLIGEIKPDVLHAWGAAAQCAASFLAPSTVPQVWSVARTTPLNANASFIEKQVFKAAKPTRAKRIVYSSAVAAAQYRRVGWPEERGAVIAAGIDAERFKPDPAARERVRKQLELPKDAVVVGMYAPYAPEYDHATLLKAVGELIRTNQHLYCVLAGRAIQKGNAPLMALVGGGTLGTRTRLIGEWSDLSALFNVCDVVCSSATVDSGRLLLAMAMSCGVPCVGTGVGAQGEVLGSFGIAVEPNSPTAMQRGLSRALDMPFDRRAFVIHEARKHIWNNFNIMRSIEKLHELYCELAPGIVATETTGARAALTLPPDLATFVPPPKPPVEAKPTPEPQAASVFQKADAPAQVANKPAESQVAATPSSTHTAATNTTDDKPWSLDAALATTVQSAVKPTAEKPAANDMLEWSAEESELISSMMVEADPSQIKQVVIEKPKPKPKPTAPSIDPEQAEAKARAQRLMEARRAELRSTTATAHTPPASKVAKG